jgi:hypothetical protein
MTGEPLEERFDRLYDAIADWKLWQRLLVGLLLGCWWWISGTVWGVLCFELFGG